MKTYFTDHFKKQLKKLKKKYPQIIKDILESFTDLDLDAQPHIGQSIYKIRIPSSDMNKGKSGAFRSYCYFYNTKDLLVPLCIYAKNEKETITNNQLKVHFELVVMELLKLQK